MMKQKKICFSLYFLLIMHYAFSQGFEIYVSDAGNFDNPPWKILKYDENGQNPEIFINQNLAWPQDILFLEDQNNVLISNLNSGIIGRYNATTGAFINNFATGIGGPTRMKIGPDNLLYVLQWSGNGRVFRYQLDGTFVDQFTNVGVVQSIGLDWDSSGNLYVSSFNGFVRRFDTLGNNIGLFVSFNLTGPTNIWFDSIGNLLVNDWSAGAVRRFDSNGFFLGNYITGLSQTEGVDFLPNGNIVIGNGGTGAVKMFNSSGTFIKDIVSSGLGGLLTPNAVIVRDNTLSVPEFEITSNFVVPTIGTEFFLSTKNTFNIESVEIYNMLGVLIKKNKLRDSLLWNANANSNGLYFIVAKNFNGLINTQKIIVKN